MQTEDEVRATIRELWSQVLENDEVAGDTDFFAAGGSSLKSLILLTELNEAFQTEFEIAELVDCRTIDRQSKAIWNRLTGMESTTGVQLAVLTRLTRVTGGVTFVAVHDVSGDVYGYISLAAELARHDVRGIKLAHERFESPEDLSIPGLAAEYVTAIKDEFDESHRLVLVGWSLGGLVGFEMAKLLEAQGRPAERLVLVDSPYEMILPDAGSFTLERERALLAEFGEHPAGESVRDLWRAVRVHLDTLTKERLAAELHLRFPLLAKAVPHLASLSASEFVGYVNRFRSVLRAGMAYRPEGTTTTVIDLLTATRSRTFDPRWSTHTSGRFRRLALDGDHFSILDRAAAPATAHAILTSGGTEPATIAARTDR